MKNIVSLRFGVLSRSRQYLPVILTLFLVGCASYFYPIELSKGTVVPKGEAIVLGRVYVTLDGKPLTWGFKSGTLFLVYLLPSTAPEAIELRVGEDGSFYWHIPPGTYTIVGFQWLDDRGHTRGRIFAEFVVPEGEPIVYIGKLTITADRNSRYRMRVADDYNQAIQNFRNKFPELKSEPAKALMKLEEQP